MQFGRRLVVVPVALLALAFTIAALPWSSGEETAMATAPAKPAATPQTKKSYQPNAQMLRWRASPRAAFYNVILWRGSARVLDLWPRTATVRVPEGRLAPGVYRWFVYPAFPKGTTHRYGRVIAHGQLKI